MPRWILLLLLLFACADEKPKQELPLDVPLANEARAGRISKPTELVGERAALGDFKLYNERVAVVIAGVRATPGFHPYGGILLDADVLRPGPVRSSFGEIVSALDLVVQRPDRVEVIADGSGGEARVRAIGGSGPLPLFQAIVGSLFPSQEYDLEWQVDYVLEPGADYVRIEHTVMNRARSDIQLASIAGFFFGTGAEPFVDGAGFARAKAGFTYDYYAAAGPDSSYVYGVPGSEIAAVFGEAGLVVTSIGAAIPLRARERKTWSHYLVIGGGDLASTWSSWRKLKGEEGGITVQGRLVDSSSTSLSAGRVHVLRAGDDPERDYVTRTLVKPDGSFSLDLPPGSYRFLAATDERLVSSEAVMDQSGEVQLTVPQTGTIDIVVWDEERRPLPAKITVQGTTPPPITEQTKFGEREHGRDSIRTEFIAGSGRLELAPGSYTVYVSRGVEYEIDEHSFAIARGESIMLESTLERSVDSTGWMSCDPHLHALLSPDSPDSNEFKVTVLAAENVELPISTEHEAVGDFNPSIRALGLEPWMKGIIGTEITTSLYGHFNAFPMTFDATKPGNGRIDWYGHTPAETFALVRALPEDPFLQVNHPRSNTIGYFSRSNLDRATMTANETFSFDFDGFEVANGCGSGSMDQDTVLDWFAFLNAGMRILATGSSDDHRAGYGTLGIPITYVEMPTDDPALADASMLRAAFERGSLVVSCGPFLHMDPIGTLVAPTAGTITINAKVAAPSWMDVDELAVIANGTVVQRIPLAPQQGTRFDAPIDVEVGAEDGWIVLWASGDQRHGIWAQNRPSYAFTNPIFVDGNGDGTWSP